MRRFSATAAAACLIASFVSVEVLVRAGLVSRLDLAFGGGLLEEPWRALTFAFVHGDALHLLCDSLVLASTALLADGIGMGGPGFVLGFFGFSFFTVLPASLAPSSLFLVGSSAGALGLFGHYFARLALLPGEGEPLALPAALGALLLAFGADGRFLPGAASVASLFHLLALSLGVASAAGAVAAGAAYKKKRRAT
jgi:membrane associated rhomboid family serine protease